MEETDLLAENIIKVEEVDSSCSFHMFLSDFKNSIKVAKIMIKEEHADNEEDYCWNSIAKDEPSDSLHSVKEEDNKDDEELEPPLAVFVQPLEEQEGVCIEETKDPLAACCEGASVATMKPETASCSPVREFRSDMRNLTDQKTIQYSVCEKRFTRKPNLHEHMRTHTEEKPFQCFVCEKCFSQKGHLDIHKRTHTGDKHFQCSVCEKCFSQKGSLDMHMRIHTGNKPFQCTICEKSFSVKGHLDTHKRIHTGEKPFQCSVCEKCFSRKGILKGHMRTHTGDKPF
ncbi:Protein glass, partial [Gryllus bimaculatus]